MNYLTKEKYNEKHETDVNKISLTSIFCFQKVSIEEPKSICYNVRKQEEIRLF